MSIVVIGVNNKTAPIDLREQAYFPKDKRAIYLQDLLNQELAQEALLLSTCNRSELYCKTDQKEIDNLKEWFCEKTACSSSRLKKELYCHVEQQAISHIMQVACGLDSMILGEPQIIGQVKEAFSAAVVVGAIDSSFHRLFKQVFALTKYIRQATRIGACPVSVVTAAIDIAKQSCPSFYQATVALLGSGETAKLLYCHLQKQLTTPIVIVSRCLEKAKALIQDNRRDFNQDVGRVYPLDELYTALQSVDILFTAIGSLSPILTKNQLDNMMQARQQKPLLLIDLAVPRDIDPTVMELPQVTLHCIDDLKGYIDLNRQSREHAAVKAHEMIQQKSMALTQEQQTFEKMTEIICAYRHQAEMLCRVELRKAKQQLAQGVNPESVLEKFAHALTQKLLHKPSTQLRQACLEGRPEALQLTKWFFPLGGSQEVGIL